MPREISERLVAHLCRALKEFWTPYLLPTVAA
jgi:hypothetical protein